MLAELLFTRQLVKLLLQGLHRLTWQQWLTRIAALETAMVLADATMENANACLDFQETLVRFSIALTIVHLLGNVSTVLVLAPQAMVVVTALNEFVPTIATIMAFAETALALVSPDGTGPLVQSQFVSPTALESVNVLPQVLANAHKGLVDMNAHFVLATVSTVFAQQLDANVYQAGKEKFVMLPFAQQTAVLMVDVPLHPHADVRMAGLELIAMNQDAIVLQRENVLPLVFVNVLLDSKVQHVHHEFAQPSVENPEELALEMVIACATLDILDFYVKNELVLMTAQEMELASIQVFATAMMDLRAMGAKLQNA